MVFQHDVAPVYRIGLAQAQPVRVSAVDGHERRDVAKITDLHPGAAGIDLGHAADVDALADLGLTVDPHQRVEAVRFEVGVR